MLKEYFSLSNSERNGLFALIMLCFIIFLIMKIWQYNYEPETVDLSSLQDSVMKFYNSSPPPPKRYKLKSDFKYDDSSNTKANKTSFTPQYTSKAQKPLPVFEINTASFSELIQVTGIGEYFATEIVKERERLGGFTNYKQLLNIYHMTPEKIASLKKQLRLDVTNIKPKIMLNSADSFRLAQIPCIDSYCAAKIVKYRKRLGGFYSTKQLLEIFSIDQERYDEIMLRVVLDSCTLQKIDINNDDFKTIMKHPYINGYDNTKAIFRYLDFDEINSWDEFIKIPNLHLINPEGLKHYVQFKPKRDKKSSNFRPQSDTVIKAIKTYQLQQ